MFDFFKIYTSDFEKQIDKFLSNLNENSDKSVIRKQILEFIKTDLITFNLWIERKYKGYQYLDRKTRIEFIENIKLFETELLEFVEKKHLDYGIYENSDKRNELNFLEKISIFLKEIYHYKYQESTNFGELFRFLKEKKIVGDCNQIVTLFIYLFNKKYDINLIKLRLFKNHVCLNLAEFDLEATTGEIIPASEQKEENKLVDVSEIIAINLLDITDSRENKFEIDAKIISEASKLAFLLSSEKELTEGNLNASLLNLAISYLKNNAPNKALEICLNSLKGDHREVILRNILNFYVSKEDFTTALKLVKHSNSYNELNKKIKKGYAITQYNKGNFNDALKIAEEISEQDISKNCYLAMYAKVQEKIKDIKTIKELRTKKDIINELNRIATKSNNPDLLKSAKSLKSILNT